MSIETASQFITTGDIARELGENPKRVSAIIYSRRIPDAGRIGNARVFNRDLVLPQMRAVLEGIHHRQKGRQHV